MAITIAHTGAYTTTSAILLNPTKIVVAADRVSS
jgi:hypothetical protein